MGRITAGDGGQGMFRWNESDLSTEVTSDPRNGIYVPATSDITGSSGAWVRQISTSVLSEFFGILEVELSPPERAKNIQIMWDICATNRWKAVMGPGVYECAMYSSGAPSNNSVLVPPSDFSCHFVKGAKFVNKTFIEETVVSFKRFFAIGSEDIYVENVRMTGELEVDGGGDTVTWYNEHNHGVNFFNCSNIYVEAIKSYNAMGDSLGIGGNTAKLSKFVTIDRVYAGAARRKSLVIESTVGCVIGRAELDNGANNCLDYEPYSFPDGEVPLDFRIDYLFCKSGTDFTSGSTTERSQEGKLDIGRWIIKPNSEVTTELIFGYSSHITCGSLVIDARRALNVGSLISVSQGFRLDVAGDLSLHVPDGYTKNSIDITAPASRPDLPQITANKIYLSGYGRLTISNNTGVINAQAVEFDCDVRADVKFSTGSKHIRNVATSGPFQNIFNVGLVRVRNSGHSAVLDSYGTFGGKPGLKIDLIITEDNTTDAPFNAVIATRGISNEQHYNIIGGFSFSGQPPSNIFKTEPGGKPVYRTSGGADSPSNFNYNGVGTPSNLPALAGSTCSRDGEIYLKTVDSDGSGDDAFGWEKLTTTA
jgi:hypothetical protein